MILYVKIVHAQHDFVHALYKTEVLVIILCTADIGHRTILVYRIVAMTKSQLETKQEWIKVREMTRSYDKSPYTHIKTQKAT